MPAADPVVPGRRARGRTRAALVFTALVVSWLAFPLFQRGWVAQDALAYVTAGRLVPGHSSAVYVRPQSSTSCQFDPRFFHDACRLAPPGTDCGRYVVPFLSPPQALPAAAAAGRTGRDLAPLLFRLAAVGALAAGMALLWRRRDRTAPGSEVAFAVTAALMTPFAYESSVAGQTSPLLFLSACIGLSATETSPALFGQAAAWSGAIAFKLFPAGLALPVVLLRRWRLLGATAGILAGLSIVAALLSPGSFGHFLAQLRATTATQTANSSNLSLDHAVRLLAPGWNTGSTLFVPSVLLRAVAVIAGGALVAKRHDDDLLWAWSWVGLLAVEPIVWWHYAAVLVPLAALIVRRRPGWSWALPLAALPLLPLAVDSAHTAAMAVLLAAAVAAALILTPGTGARRPRRPDALVRP